MKATLERLGVIASYSWPRVSDDNPFSEAHLQVQTRLADIGARHSGLSDHDRVSSQCVGTKTTSGRTAMGGIMLTSAIPFMVGRLRSRRAVPTDD